MNSHLGYQFNFHKLLAWLVTLGPNKLFIFPGMYVICSNMYGIIYNHQLVEKETLWHVIIWDTTKWRLPFPSKFVKKNIHIINTTKWSWLSKFYVKGLKMFFILINRKVLERLEGFEILRSLGYIHNMCDLIDKINTISQLMNIH